MAHPSDNPAAPTAPARPLKAVLFDAYGTLFDVHSVVARAEALFPGQGQALSQVWRDKQIDYTRLTSMSGQYKPFWELTQAALRYGCKKLGLALTPALEQQLMNQYRHLSAFPGGSLRPLLESASLFRTLSDRGLRTAHANVAPSTIARRRVRTVSATAIAAESAGLPLRTLDDLAAGRALHHEFTNESLLAYGCDVTPLSPDKAGRRLATIARDVGFCAFEYFSTDAAGHDANAAEARRRIAHLDAFLDAVLAATDLASSHVVLTSDHGNLEDLSTGSHTLNPVATTVWGPAAADVAARIRSLVDIAPTVAALAV